MPLYRLSRIEYQYPQGSDEWKDPFAAEVLDNDRPQPSPRADFTGAKRPLWQTYAYDWLGNTVTTDDDAHAFYDRSLGTVANTGYQLTGADNASKGGPRTGNLTSEYDASGNLITMAVHRQGPCMPANKCTNQHFEYEWDEVGRLVRARRFDMANPPSGTPPDAELSYTYDASDNRVLKTVGNHYTAYIFGSLELRSTTFEGDYVVGPTTETVYLQAHGVRLARVVHEVDDPYELASTRVFLELGDQLGSTSVVLDLASGELVERSTAYAYGATESDYRPERWGKFREDYRFTGKEEDIEVGLQYFGKRFYAPLLQRWVSADPLAVHAPGQADLNLYAYVHGRVLVAVDPVGLTEPQQSQAPAPSYLQDLRAAADAPKDATGQPISAAPQAAPVPGASAPRGTNPFLPLRSQSIPHQETAGERLDQLQSGLDVASMGLDATGVGAAVSWIPDLANGGLSLARGDKWGAATSAVAALPFLGLGANALRLQKDAAKAASHADDVGDLSHTVQRLLHDGEDGLDAASDVSRTKWGPEHGKGNTKHNNAIEDELDVASSEGATDIRKNRSQRDADGNRVSRRKHDAAYVLDQTRHNTNYVSNYALDNTTELNRELAAWKAITRADPAAINRLIFKF